MVRAELADGLYAITDGRARTQADLVRRVEQAIRGGARLVQYRDKQASTDERLARAAALLGLCRQHGVALIINDDIELAAAIGAHGVHLGAGDTAVATARQRLGSRAIIGASCYNRLERAHAAVTEGADYVAFGRFFASHSKPEAVPASPDLLTQARRELPVPVAAIGGITPANGAALVAAGANLLAVIHGVFGQPDIEAAAQAYARLFDRVRCET
ncbi:MAG TPA: thiamine phosphate synthase [Gammaproteobacteria bacterium]|nr:thiamine phosphate synthase [Gammaproteobacteria bacterium]